ncbi:MAG: SIMPL domain-containing protein [Croceibacterium sp.]
MFIRKFVLAAALAAAGTGATIPASAQTAQPATMAAPGNTLLSISASGESIRAPDLAVFNAGVTTQGTTAAAALTDNARAMTQVIAALKRAGIAERDIQTSNISVNPLYGDQNRAGSQSQAPQIVGYQASNNLTVRHHDIRNFGSVIDALAAAGANQINGPSFQLDDDAAALREARLDALKQARERADFYAQATGLRVVRILSISEGGGGFNGPMPMFARTDAVKSTPIQPGEVQSGVTLSVIYELAPR